MYIRQLEHITIAIKGCVIAISWHHVMLLASGFDYSLIIVFTEQNSNIMGR